MPVPNPPHLKCIKMYEFANDKIKVKTLKRMKEVKFMIKKIAWETFKNTGDINAFMELKQIEDIEKELDGDSLKYLKEGLDDSSFDENNL